MAALVMRWISWCLLAWLLVVGAGAAGGTALGAAPAVAVEVPWSARLLAAATAFGGGVGLGLTPSALALALSRLGGLRGPRAAGGVAALAGGSIGALWGLGLAALALEGHGRAVAWGAQLQEPTLIVLLAVASLGLSLALWDLLPRPAATPAGAPGRSATGSSAPPRPRRPGPLAGGLLAGVLLVPLALPWSPPGVAEPIGLALQGSVASVLTVATCLGLGMALPAVAAGLVPAAGPLPSAWRGGLGFLPIVTVVWLLYALGAHLAADRLAYVQLALLAAALFSWLGRQAAERPAVRHVHSVAAVAAALAAIGVAAGG